MAGDVGTEASPLLHPAPTWLHSTRPDPTRTLSTGLDSTRLVSTRLDPDPDPTRHDPDPDTDPVPLAHMLPQPVSDSPSLAALFPTLAVTP